MKYWLCIYRGEEIDTQEQYEELYPVVGSLFVAKKNEEPPTIHKDDKWVEISREEYENALNNEDYIIKYDGVHCIGKCTECLNWKNKEHLCIEKNQKISNSGTYKNCCIFKD